MAEKIAFQINFACRGLCLVRRRRRSYIYTHEPPLNTNRIKRHRQRIKKKKKIASTIKKNKPHHIQHNLMRFINLQFLFKNLPVYIRISRASSSIQMFFPILYYSCILRQPHTQEARISMEEQQMLYTHEDRSRVYKNKH